MKKILGIAAAFVMVFGVVGVIQSASAGSLTVEQRFQMCLDRVNQIVPVSTYRLDHTSVLILPGNTYGLSNYRTGITNFDSASLYEVGVVTCAVENDLRHGITPRAAQTDVQDRLTQTAWTLNLGSTGMIQRVLVNSAGKPVGSPESVAIGSDRYLQLVEIGVLPSSIDGFVAMVDGQVNPYTCFPDENGTFPASCPAVN